MHRTARRPNTRRSSGLQGWRAARFTCGDRMPNARPASPLRWWSPLLVAACALLLWVAATHRWHAADWTRPDSYSGDPLEIFTRVQIAADDPWQPLLGFPESGRLGTPFGADWSGFPVGDAPTFAFAGLLARVVGPFAAASVVAGLLCAATAASFYVCGRWLRWRPEWAALGAILFAFSNYQQRWSITLSFNQTWTLPPLLLLCAIAARRAPPSGQQRRWRLIAAVIGFWIGLGNPYFVFFTGALAAGTLVLAWFRRAPRERMLLPLTFLGVMTLAMVLGHLGYFAGLLTATDSGQFRRGLAGADLYAFKPLELFLPPPDHRWWFLRDIGRIYEGAQTTRGEPFYNYAGIVGGAGLLLLAGTALRRRPLGRMPDAAAGALFCAALTVVGGGNTLLAFTGFDWFRAGGRIGILFPLWGLLTLAAVLNRWTLNRPRAVGIALAATLGAFGWIEQTPGPGRHTDRDWVEAAVAADRATTAELVKYLGPRPRLFQLPFVPFPEAGPIVGMSDYEHFRPFLASPTVDVSYGGLRGAPASIWAERTARLPTNAMVELLNTTGFSALWIDRRAYADRADRMLNQFRALGLKEIATARAPDIAVFTLQPDAKARIPGLADPRLHPAWDSAATVALGQPEPLALRGWYLPDRSATRAWRWAANEAELGVFWDGPARTATVQFEADSRMRGTLVVRAGAKILWSGELPGAHAVPVQFDVPLATGLTRLELAFDGLARRGPDPRLLGFNIAQLGVRLD